MFFEVVLCRFVAACSRCGHYELLLYGKSYMKIIKMFLWCSIKNKKDLNHRSTVYSAKLSLGL